MKILVTGASGFVGNPLVERLLDRDHEVVAVSRGRRDSSGRVQWVQWDPMSGPAPAEAVTGVEAVVHLAGETVVGRWTDAKKQRIVDSRVVGTRNLVAGLVAHGVTPRSFVSASAIGYYGARGEEELSEKSTPGSDFLAETSIAWEREATLEGSAVSHLRIGIVLHPSGGALGQMLLPAKFGGNGPLGSGRQWWSWIHREDLVSMILTAAEEGWSGAHNATAPGAVRQAEFARVLGRVLRRPSFLPLPAFVLKIVFGEFSTELLTSKKVRPTAAVDRGFAFAHPELEGALRDLL
jgi:uncharacterized protein (TIGR01777 family)